MTFPTLALALALAVVIGLSLGLLGGGGSILTVPVLLYVVGMPAHEAIATSLFVVGATSVVAATQHARAGNVKYRVGLAFGAASMLGAYGAGRASKLVPQTLLLVMFGGIMLVAAVSMLRRAGSKGAAEPATERATSYPTLLAQGLLVGALTGLVGAGGGFVLVPALVVFARLPMKRAVGTSLMIIAMNSFAGFAGYVESVTIAWPLTLGLAAAAIAGSFAGASLAHRVDPGGLRKGFGWFVIVMAVFMLVQQLPKALGVPFSLAQHWTLVVGVMAVVVVTAIIGLVRSVRRAERPLAQEENVKGAA